MAHELTAIIASAQAIRVLANEIGGLIQTEPLNQGVALIRVPFDIVNVVSGDFENDLLAFNAQFNALPKRWIEPIQRASTTSPIAFVVTEYSGGLGYQGALVLERGEIVYGPVVDESVSETLLAEGLDCPPPPTPKPINAALRHLGVTHTDDLDEFDAVGLSQLRP